MRETVKKLKRSKTPKIDFSPTTEEEEKYLMKLESLLEIKRRGDWGLVGQMLKIPTASAEKAFLRLYSKNHFKAVDALEKIINNRNELLKNLI